MQAAMTRLVEFGVLPGQSLLMLERVIKNVYLPIFEPEVRANSPFLSLPAGC